MSTKLDSDRKAAALARITRRMLFDIRRPAPAHGCAADYLGRALLEARGGHAIDVALAGLVVPLAGPADDRAGRLVVAAARAVSRRRPPGCASPGCAPGVSVSERWDPVYLGRLPASLVRSAAAVERVRLALAALVTCEVWHHAGGDYVRERGAELDPGATLASPQALIDRSPELVELVLDAGDQASRMLLCDTMRFLAAARDLLGAGDNDHRAFGDRLEALDPDRASEAYRRAFDADRSMPTTKFQHILNMLNGSPSFAPVPGIIDLMLVETGWLDEDEAAPPASGGSGAKGNGGDARAPARGAMMYERNDEEQQLRWASGFAALELCELIGDARGAPGYAVVDRFRAEQRRVRAHEAARFEALLLAQLEYIARTHGDRAAELAAGRLAVEPRPEERGWWVTLAGTLGWRPSRAAKRGWLLALAGALCVVAALLVLPSRDPSPPERLRGREVEAVLRLGDRFCPADQLRPPDEPPCHWRPSREEFHAFGRVEKIAGLQQVTVATLDVLGDLTVLEASPFTPSADCTEGMCPVFGGVLKAPPGPLRVLVSFSREVLREKEIRARLRATAPDPRVFTFRIDVAAD